MTTTTAPASVAVLVDRLEGLGWGDLDGQSLRGVRDVLRALVRIAPHGRVVTTGLQLASRVGLSERWTRYCLHRLEAHGIIRWTRGHIEAGRPRPGWITISRQRLAQLIGHARQLARHRRQLAADAFTARSRTLRNATIWPRKHRQPLSIHAELSSSLPLGEGQGDALRAASPPSPVALTEGNQAMQPCIHNLSDINKCATCHRIVRENPTIDVKTLYQRPEPLKPPPPGWREAARAAARQAHVAESQGSLL